MPQESMRKEVQQQRQLMDAVIQQLSDQQQQLRDQEFLQQSPQEQTVYQQFTNSLTALPNGIPVVQQPAQQDNAGRKERRRREKAMKAELKQAGSELRLMSPEDVQQLKIFQTPEGMRQWVQRKTPHTGLPMAESLRMARQGDYSDFENLDGVMRNMLAKQALSRLNQDYGIDRFSRPQEICDRIRAASPGVSGLLDPALRLGLSLVQREKGLSKELRGFYQALDEAMSTAVMEETLIHKADAQVVGRDIAAKNPKLTQNKVRDMTREAIAANEAQQVQMAKRLLLMQLSNFQRVDKVNGKLTPSPWDKTMAVALSHCSRVVLTMPKLDVRSDNNEEAHEVMWQRIFYRSTPGEDPNAARDNARGGSTHSVARRKVEQGGGHSREQKKIYNPIGQRGMNCAVGGMGNVGVSGRTISNDGSCGHFYSMFKRAKRKGLFHKEQYGAMLMGIESDAYGVKNHLGHTHDIHATGEKASSLGGQRTDEVGEKYGGRQCDLSSMTAAEVSEWMLTLEQAMIRWQSQPGGIAGSPEGTEAMKMLAGWKLDQAGLARLRSLCQGAGGAPAQ